MVTELEIGKTYLIFTSDGNRQPKKKRRKTGVGSNRGRYYVISRTKCEYEVRFCGNPAEGVEILHAISVADLICGYVHAFPDTSGCLGSIEIPHA